MTDKQLLRITREFRKGVLGKRSSHLMCGMVCWPLQSYLRMLGVPTSLHEGMVGDCNHLWLELPDGRVLDPTADQFSDDETTYPIVHLGQRLNIHNMVAAE